MAIVTTSTGASDTWSNVIEAGTVEHLQFDLTQLPTLTDSNGLPVIGNEGSNLVFTFGGEHLVFTAADTFTLSPPSGTIAGFESSDTVVSGLSVALPTFFGLMREGDVDGLNAAVWSGADTITGGASDDFVRGFGGADTLNGGDGDDRLFGDGGADKLYGGAGNDTLYSGVGADKLFGQAGNDRLNGGAGNDQLNGGAGADKMIGGSGADTFIWKTLAEMSGPGAGPLPTPDSVYDFSHAEGDRIDVSAIDANPGLAGNQAFAFIGGDAFGTDTPGQIRVMVNPAHPAVYTVAFNTDADAQPEATIVVTSQSGQPGADDFIL